MEIEKEKQKTEKKARKLVSESGAERRPSKKKESISWQDRYNAMNNGQTRSTASARPSLSGVPEVDSPTSTTEDAAFGESKKPFSRERGDSSPPVPVPLPRPVSAVVSPPPAPPAASVTVTESESSMTDSPSPPLPPSTSGTSGHKRRVSFDTPDAAAPALALKLQQKQDAEAAAVTPPPTIDPNRDSIRSDALSTASTPVLHGAGGGRGPVFSTHSDVSSARTVRVGNEDSDDDSDFDESVDYRSDPKYDVSVGKVDLSDKPRVFVSPTPLLTGRGYSTRSYGTVKSNATLHYSSAYPQGEGEDGEVSSRTAPDGAVHGAASSDSPIPLTYVSPGGSEQSSAKPPPPASPKPSADTAGSFTAPVPPVEVKVDKPTVIVAPVSVPVVVPTNPSPPPPAPPAPAAVRLSVSSPPTPPPPSGVSPKGPSPPPPPAGPSPTDRASGSFAARKESFGAGGEDSQPVKPSGGGLGSLFGFASSTATTTGGDSGKNPPPPSTKPVHYLEDDSNNGMITLSMPIVKPLPPRPPPPVVAAPNKRSSQRLIVKSVRMSTRITTQPQSFHIESEMVDVPEGEVEKEWQSPSKRAAHPLTSGILGGAKLAPPAPREDSHSPGHDATNRDGSESIARRESAPPAIGNIFAAIRRGSTLKKVDVKEEEEKKQAHNRAKSMGGFGDSSTVAAILERRKFLEAESSGSESENDWD
eukprot:gene31090-38422_t